MKNKIGKALGKFQIGRQYLYIHITSYFVKNKIAFQHKGNNI